VPDGKALEACRELGRLLAARLKSRAGA
jgi:hypothetical protein